MSEPSSLSSKVSGVFKVHGQVAAGHRGLHHDPPHQRLNDRRHRGRTLRQQLRLPGRVWQTVESTSNALSAGATASSSVRGRCRVQDRNEQDDQCGVPRDAAPLRSGAWSRSARPRRRRPGREQASAAVVTAWSRCATNTNVVQRYHDVKVSVL